MQISEQLPAVSLTSRTGLNTEQLILISICRWMNGKKKDTYHVQMMMIKRVRFQLKIEKEILKNNPRV